jgi:transposase
MTYSEDLRKRVVAFVQGGGSKSEGARLFKVSRGCVYLWLNCKNLAPKRVRNTQPYTLNEAELKTHVEKYPDAYQHERAAALGVSWHVVLYGLRRLGITRKR